MKIHIISSDLYVCETIENEIFVPNHPLWWNCYWWDQIVSRKFNVQLNFIHWFRQERNKRKRWIEGLWIVIFTGLPAVETAWERSALAIDKPKVYWSNLDKKNDQYDWKDKKSLHFCFRTKLFFFFFIF
jgi:hypothetical protein